MPLSYCANMNYEQFGRLKMDELSQPAKYVWTWDANNQWESYWYTPTESALDGPNSGTYRPWRDASFRHNGMANCGFLDGHVKNLSEGGMRSGILANAVAFNPYIHD